MKFDRVAFAGSVLPRDFGWRDLMSGSSPQVKLLRNDCANADWPVGFLCSGLAGLRRRDIGTGGYEGFYHDDQRVFQYWFHEGGHGAARGERNLTSIAHFMAFGDERGKPEELVGGKPGFGLVSRLARWVFRILVAALIGILLYGLVVQSVTLVLSVIGLVVLLAFVLKVL